MLRFQPMQLYEVAIACRAYTAFGGEFDDSFRQFVTKIVDEYFWVTITRGFVIPKLSDLRTSTTLNEG